LRAIHYYIYGIHKPILTWTHPNLPKGKELVPDERDEGEWGEGNERLLTGGRSLVPFGI